MTVLVGEVCLFSSRKHVSENTELLEKSVVFFSSRREDRLSVHVLRPLEGRYTAPESGICGMTNGRWGNIQCREEKTLLHCHFVHYASRRFYSALRKVFYYSAHKKFHKRGETFSI